MVLQILALVLFLIFGIGVMTLLWLIVFWTIRVHKEIQRLYSLIDKKEFKTEGPKKKVVPPKPTYQ